MPSRLTTQDRLDILDLMARYAWAIDTGDVEAYVQCFTPGAVLTMRGVLHKGHQAIRVYVTSVVTRPEFPGRQHHHNEVRIEGNAGRCTVSSYSMITQRFESGETRIMFAGSYQDIVVKLGARWLFEARTWDVWKA